MAKERTWHGVDVSTEISLFEYGFIMRWSPIDKMYQVVFKYPVSEDKRDYFYTWVDIDDYRKDIKSGDTWIDVDGIASCCDWESNGGIDGLSDCSLLSDLLTYYGAYVILVGGHMYGYTENEIRKKLGRAIH